MSRINLTLSWISGVIAAVVTGLAKELADKNLVPFMGASKIVFVALCTLVALFVLQWAMRQIPKKSRGRKLLLGDSWVEGWWHIRTFSAGHDTKPIPPGLMHVTYSGPNLDLRIGVYRPTKGVPDLDGTPLYTRSIMAALRDTDYQLVNYCEFPEESGSSRSLGIGNFSCDRASQPPGRYEGVVIRVSDAPHRRQAATRIPQEDIIAAQTTHGQRWITELLKELENPQVARRTGPTPS